MSYRVIGRCSNCGGEVILYFDWYATVPQKPTCKNCGAHASNTGPIIQMDPPE